MENKSTKSNSELLNGVDVLPTVQKLSQEPVEYDSNTLTYSQQRKLCLDNSYFDSEYYLKNNPDVLENDSDPLEHFLVIGFKENRNPNPVFQTEYYKIKYQLEDEELNPVIHFLTKGQYLGYAVHENHPFASQCYELLRLYFDEENYFSENEKKVTYVNPLEHYLKVGYLEDRNVSALFDKVYYEELCPESKIYSDSFLHFVNEGELNKSLFHPLFDYEYYDYACRESATSLFHKRPYADFLLRSQKEFVSPCRLFDGEFYLSENLDVKKSDVNPFLHYVKNGFSEIPARDPHPFFSVEYYRNLANIDRSIEPIGHFLCSENANEIPTGFNLDLRSWCRDKMSIHNLDNQPNTLLNYIESSALDKRNYIHDDFLLKERVRELVSFYEDNVVDPNVLEFVKYEKPLVSIIIPNYNQTEATLNCLHSLLKAKTECSFEVIVVDDASTDVNTILFDSILGINLQRNQVNQGYIGSCNKGADIAQGEFIVQLNNDTLLIDYWLDALLASFDVLPDVGLVGALLLFPDGLIQEAGGVIWEDGSGLNFGRAQESYHCSTSYLRQVDYCSGACIMLRKSLWDELNGYDSYYSPAYYEDTDLAFRVRELGFKVVYQPQAKVVHLEGLSSGTDETQGVKRFQRINKDKFLSRWGKVLAKHKQKNFRDRYSIANVLFIDAYTPTPDRDSGSLDIMNYIQFFQDCNYKVSFLPMMNMVAEGKYTKDLQATGVEWIGSPGYNSAYEYLNTEGHFYDLVILYRAHVTYVLVDLVRESCPQAQVVYDTVDLHHLRHLREAALTNDSNEYRNASIVKRQEMSNILKTDATILLSDYEYNILRHSVDSDLLHVIPIARACIGTHIGYGHRKDILFLGGFSHTPNIDCMRYLATDIMPLLLQKAPNIKLRVVGADLTQEVLGFASENILIEGYIEDLAEVFESVKMLVAPLRIGAGMKGKVVSALTHGLPCVVSEVAAEGMNLTNNQGVIIANKPEEIVSSIMKLYEDEVFWTDMSKNAFELAQENFSVKNTYDKLYALLEKLSLPVPTDLMSLKRNIAQ